MKIIAESFGLGVQLNTANNSLIVYRDITKRKIVISIIAMLAVFIVQTLDSIPTDAYGQFSDPGFDGIEFGSPVPDELQWKEDKGNIQWYIRPDDSLQVDNVRLMDVTYGFRNGQFVEAIIHVNRRNVDRLRNLLIKEYGPSMYVTDGSPINIWLNPLGIMSLTFYPKSDKGTWQIVSTTAPDRFPLSE